MAENFYEEEIQLEKPQSSVQEEAKAPSPKKIPAIQDDITQQPLDEIPQRAQAQTPDLHRLPPKYTIDSKIEMIRTTLVADGIRQGLKKEEVVENVDKTLA